MEDADRAGDFAKPLGYPDTPTRSNQNITQAVIQRQMGRFKGLVSGEFQRAAEDKLIEKPILREMVMIIDCFITYTFCDITIVCFMIDFIRFLELAIDNHPMIVWCRFW